MSDFFLYLVGIGGALILFTNIVLFFYIFLKPQKDIKETPIHLNFLSSFDNGFFIGNETKVENGKNQRRLVTMSPKDVDVNKGDIKDVQIIVDKNQYHVFPKGDLSRERTITMSVPKNPQDLPPAFRQTIIGKGYMWAIALQDAINAELDSVTEGSKRKTDILKRLGDGEISKEFLDFNDELVKDAIKTVLESKSKDKNFNPLLPQSHG